MARRPLTVDVLSRLCRLLSARAQSPAEPDWAGLEAVTLRHLQTILALHPSAAVAALGHWRVQSA